MSEQAQTQGQVSSESSESSESSAQVAEDTQKADAAPQTVSEKKAEAKRVKALKLKVDGKEFTEELPFEIPEEAQDYMSKNLQLAKAAQKRMQEKATLENQVQEFLEVLRTDPRKILSDPSIGVDLKNLAKQIIEEEIENAKKSPEQLEKERLENELRSLKEQREKEQKDFREKELARLTEQEYERYDMLMTEALKESDIPKSPYVIKKMADYLSIGLENGTSLSPKDVLPLVREEIIKDIRDMFSVMPEEVIENIVGKDKISNIRKKKVAQAKAAPSSVSQVKDTGTADKKVETKEEKKQTLREFFGV